MKMNSRGYTKDVVIKDTKTPALLMQYYPDESPDILIPINGDIWVCEFNEFFDAGLDESVIFTLINRKDCASRADARIAFEYFRNGADSHEYGEPTEPGEAEHRRIHFATLFKMKKGHDLIFKTKTKEV